MNFQSGHVCHTCAALLVLGGNIVAVLIYEFRLAPEKIMFPGVGEGREAAES
jgi:hypothetical protein